jgi:type I restriction enzyme S subunit
MSRARLKSLAALVTSCEESRTRPYVALENIESGTGSLVPGTELTEVPPPANGAAAVERGDVLFGKLRPYLAKCWLVDRPALASTELLCLRPRVGVDSRWLSYVCASRPLVDWAVATSDGTKMPRTSWEKLAEYRLAVPQLRSQRAIADYLDTETARIGVLIAKKRRMIDLLGRRGEALIEQEVRWLVDEFGATPLKFAARRVEVGIVVTPSTWYADVGVLALRGVNVKPGSVDLTDVVRISDAGHQLHRKSQLRAGDVVVVRTGQAGAAAVVPPDLDGCNCIDLVIVRPMSTVLPKFLEFVLNSDWTQKHIDQFSVGTIQSHFNVGAMKEVPLSLPAPENQLQVVERLNSATQQAAELTSRLARQIELLVEHRQALITAAVTGELEIPGVAA